MNDLVKKLLLLSFLLSTFASAGFDSALKKQKFLLFVWVRLVATMAA